MPPSTTKRMSGGWIKPRLIDNKRKLLERSLSAAPRDQLFMKEMGNDAEFNLFQIVRENQMIVFQTQLKKFLSQCQV